MDINILLYVSFLVLCVTLTLTESKVEQSEDGTEGKISFSTPDLNDEEEHSPFMPTQLKCDACRVIVHKLYEKFTDVNKKRKSLKYKLPESEVLDATEAICGDKDTFDGYGIKEVKKVSKVLFLYQIIPKCKAWIKSNFRHQSDYILPIDLKLP